MIADYDAQIVIGEKGVTVGGVDIPGVLEANGVKIRPGFSRGEWIVDFSLVTGRPPVIDAKPTEL